MCYIRLLDFAFFLTSYDNEVALDYFAIKLYTIFRLFESIYEFIILYIRTINTTALIGKNQGTMLYVTNIFNCILRGFNCGYEVGVRNIGTFNVSSFRRKN